MHVGRCLRVCGDWNIALVDSSYLWNQGSIYSDSIVDEATILNDGYIDVGGPNGGYFVFNGGSDSGGYPGCLYGHLAPQICQPPEFIYSDTAAWSIIKAGNKVTFSFDQIFCFPVLISFGDGNTAVSRGGNLIHNYAHSGNYKVTVTMVFLCDTFKSEKSIQIDSVCSTQATFSVYPNPCSDYFYVRYQSCDSGILSLPVFDMPGKWIEDVRVDNAAAPVKVNTDNLASGVYFIRMPDDIKKSATVKIVVLH